MAQLTRGGGQGTGDKTRKRTRGVGNMTYGSNVDEGRNPKETEKGQQTRENIK